LGGGTLLYRRDAWAASPFPDLAVGEVSAFLDRLPPDRIHAMDDPSLCVAVVHDRNTTGRTPAGPHWQRRPLDEVSRLIGGDRDFYAMLRNGATARPVPGRGALSPVTVVAPFMVYDGYGSMAEYLVLGMERAGARVDVIPLGIDPNGLTPE